LIPNFRIRASLQATGGHTFGSFLLPAPRMAFKACEPSDAMILAIQARLGAKTQCQPNPDRDQVSTLTASSQTSAMPATASSAPASGFAQPRAPVRVSVPSSSANAQREELSAPGFGNSAAIGLPPRPPALSSVLADKESRAPISIGSARQASVRVPAYSPKVSFELSRPNTGDPVAQKNIRSLCNATCFSAHQT